LVGDGKKSDLATRDYAHPSRIMYIANGWFMQLWQLVQCILVKLSGQISTIATKSKDEQYHYDPSINHTDRESEKVQEVLKINFKIWRLNVQGCDTAQSALCWQYLKKFSPRLKVL